MHSTSHPRRHPGEHPRRHRHKHPTGHSTAHGNYSSLGRDLLLEHFSSAHPASGGCTLAQGMQCMHRRSRFLRPLRCISCMLLCSGSCKLTGSPGILKFPGGADAGALRPPQHLHMPCWAYPVDSRPFYSSCDSRVGCPSSRGTQVSSRFTILLPYCFINLRLRKL